jgi:urease subunit alpha
VIKGGFAAWGAIGEGNATVSRSEPVVYAPHWGGSGVAPGALSVNFISEAGAPAFAKHVPSRRRAVPIQGTRRVSKRHMLYNQSNPSISIDPATAAITIDGRPLPQIPDDDLPLDRRYMLL